MAFKGKTTAGYNPKTGAKRAPAMTGGKVGGNPNKRPLPGSKANVVTRPTQTGSNPRNSRTQSLNANRVQRAGGPRTNPKQVGVQRAANIVSPAARGKGNMSATPFGGYKKLANSRAVPAGKGNIRNAGSVQRTDSNRLQGATNFKLPKKALDNKGSFGGFIGK